MPDPIHNPSLTFVIPAYGEAPYLEETLQSLLTQTHPCPIIIRWVKKPKTRAFVAPTQVQLIETDEAQGIGGDWEAALRSASTPWVTLAHSDDLYLPDYARLVMDAIQRFPSSGVIFTEAAYQHSGFAHQLLQWFKKRINPASRWRVFSPAHPRIISAKEIRKALRWGSFIICPTVSYQVGLLPRPFFSKSYKTALDWKAWIDLASLGKDFVYLPMPLVRLRVHADATTQITLRSGDRKREEIELLRIYWGPGMMRLMELALRFARFLQAIPRDRSP